MVYFIDFYEIDGVVPSVTVRDSNHWLAIKTGRCRLLDACNYLGRVGSLRNFLQNMLPADVGKHYGKLYFPFRLLDDYSKLWSVTEFPPLESFKNTFTGQNDLGADYRTYEKMMAQKGTKRRSRF